MLSVTKSKDKFLFTCLDWLTGGLYGKASLICFLFPSFSGSKWFTNWEVTVFHGY